jgi:hypothetical protein
VKIKEETSPVRAGRPAGATATEVSTTVRIENVDRNGEFVTFTGPRGLRTVRVRDPEVRNYVRTLKSGDNVEVTYREALALSLEKVAR